MFQFTSSSYFLHIKCEQVLIPIHLIPSLYINLNISEPIKRTGMLLNSK